MVVPEPRLPVRSMSYLLDPTKLSKRILIRRRAPSQPAATTSSGELSNTCPWQKEAALTTCDISALMRLAEIGHETASRERGIDFERCAKDGIGERQRRASFAGSPRCGYSSAHIR